MNAPNLLTVSACRQITTQDRMLFVTFCQVVTLSTVCQTYSSFVSLTGSTLFTLNMKITCFLLLVSVVTSRRIPGYVPCQTSKCQEFYLGHCSFGWRRKQCGALVELNQLLMDVLLFGLLQSEIPVIVLCFL